MLYEYRAFGEQLKKLDASGTDTGDNAKYSYGGKELDDESDLYYFNARYYDATTGRFINVDPIQDGTNWYVYCSNNPLNRVDPTGLEDLDLVEDKNKFMKNGILYDFDESFSGDQKMFDKEGSDRVGTHCLPTAILVGFGKYFNITNRDALESVQWAKDNGYLDNEGKAGTYYNAIQGNQVDSMGKFSSLVDTFSTILTSIPQSPTSWPIVSDFTKEKVGLLKQLYSESINEENNGLIQLNSDSQFHRDINYIKEYRRE